MEVFGIIGMSIGTTGFVFAIIAYNRIAALEQKLQQAGILAEEADVT